MMQDLWFLFLFFFGKKTPPLLSFLEDIYLGVKPASEKNKKTIAWILEYN